MSDSQQDAMLTELLNVSGQCVHMTVCMRHIDMLLWVARLPLWSQGDRGKVSADLPCFDAHSLFDVPPLLLQAARCREEVLAVWTVS